MKIRVDNKAYLNGAMTVMTTMLDYAVNICHEQIDCIFRKFIDLEFAL